MQREAFEKAIKDAIVKRAATSRSARETIYEAARASLRRRPGLVQVDFAQLDATIEAIEATFMRQERPSRDSGSARPLRIATIALLAGVALGAGVSSYVHARSSPAETAGEVAALEELKRAYDDQVQLMPEATRFIRQVVDAIVERQRRDRASLDASAKSFIALAKFDPDLSKEMPKDLPPGTAVTLRADATNLKVLMNWTLCGVASISNPEMVDKKRAGPPSIGCPYFGLWTNGGANW